MARVRAGHAPDLATLLRRAGGKPRRPLAACISDAELIAKLARAAASLDKAFFPIDPELPGSTKRRLLEQAGPDLLVSNEDFNKDFNIIGDKEIAAAEVASPLAPPALESVALILATSGSSGEPKAVMLTHANLIASARLSAARTPLAEGDRWLACLPLFHVGGFSILSRCAQAGATAVLTSKFDPEAILSVLHKERISHVSLVPVMLAQLLDACGDAPAPPALRHVLVGGAALAPSLAEAARVRGWPIQPTYGMSETASQVATLPSLPLDWRAGHVGRPLPGIELALASDQRLMVRGPVVMAGYANPDLTPGDGLTDGWLVTSDIAEISRAGELTIIGRADDMIVTGGKKVSPAAIEQLLAEYPGVAEVGVVGRPHPEWGETIAAVFGGSADCEQLLAWAREHLPSHWRPRLALRVEALPRLANGKPDRSALRKLSEGLDAEAGKRRKL